jgi:hypothetical protein
LQPDSHSDITFQANHISPRIEAFFVHFWSPAAAAISENMHMQRVSPIGCTATLKLD